MKALALCNKGIEDIAALEIKESIGKKSWQFSGYITFEIKEKEELCKLAYLGQSIRKVLLVLDEIKYHKKEDIITHAKKLNLKAWLSEDKTFKVEVEVDTAPINSEEMKAEIGGAIIESITEYRQKAKMQNPDLIIFTYINQNHAFYCIDFSGRDLSKREYRIFSHPRNIKSTIAYAMVRLSGYKKGEKLIDPFCLSGSIPIEAALYLNSFPVNFFEKEDFAFLKFMKFDFSEIDKLGKEENNIHALDNLFRNVDAAKKNAKIAGINKSINFSRMDVEWLDTKFDSKSVDRIVTCMPNISKNTDEKSVLKVYNEFFYQAEFVLKKGGSILVCTLNPDEVKKAASEKGFNVEFEREVRQGEEKLNLIKLEKE